jgi:hypothetical protein
LARGIGAVGEAGSYVVTNYGSDVRAVAAGAVPFLKLMGVVTGGWMMARAALAAQAKIAAGDSDPFFATKIATARFYADHVMAQAPGLAQVVVNGGASALAVSEEMLG